MLVNRRLVFLVFLLVFGLFGGTLQASTTWTTGHYGNNVNRSKTLSISGASSLTVTVLGETENSYDFIYIYDANGQQIKRFTGHINETFTVSGSSIKAKLTSDYSQTRSGVTVTIASVGNSNASGGSDNNSWTTGHYSNNTNRSKTLSISDASSLTVTVIGSTEAGYDYIYIYDANGNQVKRLSGLINETFTVSGSSIKAKLTSDYSQTRSGVTVTIASTGSGGSSSSSGNSNPYPHNLGISITEIARTTNDVYMTIEFNQDYDTMYSVRQIVKFSNAYVVDFLPAPTDEEDFRNIMTSSLIGLTDSFNIQTILQIAESFAATRNSDASKKVVSYSMTQLGSVIKRWVVHLKRINSSTPKISYYEQIVHTGGSDYGTNIWFQTNRDELIRNEQVGTSKYLNNARSITFGNIH